MEDQVPFKVFTYWNEDDKPEVRRFGIEKSVVTSFHYLNAKLQEVFPGLKNKNYNVSWKDEEDDDVTVSSDNEVMIALVAMQSQNLIKLYVYCKDQKYDNDECEVLLVNTATNKACPNVSMPHCGVICDGCESPVVGFRYKCTTCDDFDLCSKCEGAGMHPEHCMVRVPMPNMPHTVIKAAIKRSHHFLKTIEEEHSKRRRERNIERKRHGHSHGHHSSDREHQRHTRTSWLDTFANYMNEFANLAGEVNIENPQDLNAKADPKNKDTSADPKNEGTSADTKNEDTSADPKKKDTSGDPKKKDTSADPKKKKKSKSQSQCPFGENKEAQMISNLLGAILGNVLQVPSTSATNNQSEPQVPVNVDVEMGQGDRAEQEDKESKQSQSSSSSEESKRENTPEIEKDKVDGWTLINKEKDLQDTKAKVDSDEAPAIGFNLPKEFQTRMNISSPQNIYPPLNMSTAVLNPKEAEKTTAPTEPQAAGNSQASNTANPSAPDADKETKKHHPLTHIDVAIEQMIGMGFTNEGGWLTQLLESKNGNIAAVLDLLTPVNPKK